MQIEITRKFRKQVEACNDMGIKLKVSHIIEVVIATDTLNNFPNLKKLSGHKNSFRIRAPHSQYFSSNQNTII